VLVAVIIAVILTVVVGTIALRAQIRSRTLDGTVHGTIILFSMIVDRNLTYTDITRDMSPDNRADLNADVINLKRRGELVGLTIWSLADGQLVYTDHETVQKSPPPPEVLEQARKGAPFISKDNPDPGVLVVNYPYDANGDGRMDALAEVLLPSAPVEEAVARSTRLLYLGSFVVLLLTIAGVLQVRRQQTRQDYAAVHDALTGLGNRLLLRRVSAPILAAASEQSPAALLVIDLDHFKAVNDTLGHHAGDELLVAVAGMIRRTSGPTSVAARLGGDEFAVLLPQDADREQARTIARRIRKVVREPIMIAGYEVEVDASVGLAWAPADGHQLGDLMRRADVAMYWAKCSGDGIAEYAEVAENVPPQPRVTTLAQLSQALADEELELYYQPVRAASGAVTSVEVLARWHHPELGLLDAGMFIPALAHTSLDSTLTEWVLRQATRQCVKWRVSGLDITISVNISARSLHSDSLAALVRDVVDETQLPMSALELEIPEAIVVHEATLAIPAMRRLNSVGGVGLCLDNFGATYGAISALADAPVQRVKIDRRYTRDVVNSSLARTVVGGWVRVAHGLGLVVVAQGVETPAASRCLIDLGCDEVQGFGIGRPMPAAELTRWFSETGAPVHPTWSSEGRQEESAPTPDGA
jgi:diguanylate cyclase (GGDEF)-like protein